MAWRRWRSKCWQLHELSRKCAVLLVPVMLFTGCAEKNNTNSPPSEVAPPDANIPSPPITDSTSPILDILSPGSVVSVSTNAINVSGTATDNVGVTQVNVRNDRSGTINASGTGSWSASVDLQSGSNVITVTAYDAAGNMSTSKNVTVTYTLPATFVATVSWPPNSDNPSGYNIYVSATSGGVTSLVATLAQGGSWNAAAPSVEIPSSTLRLLLGAGTQACFEVRAYNIAGNSASSPVTCINLS